MSYERSENVRMMLNIFQNTNADRQKIVLTDRRLSPDLQTETVGEAQTESGTGESGGQTRGTDIQVRGYGQSV